MGGSQWISWVEKRWWDLLMLTVTGLATVVCVRGCWSYWTQRRSLVGGARLDRAEDDDNVGFNG